MIRLTMLLVLFLGMQAGEYVVVTSRQSPIDTLSEKKLRDIFLKKRQFVDGIQVLPINLSPTDPIRIAFEERVLQMDRESLSEHWVVRHYQGIKPPIVQRSERGVQAFVINQPGALGYLKKEMLDGGMKVLYEF